MRRILFALACTLVGACSSKMPTAPSVARAASDEVVATVVPVPVVPVAVGPQHHNIPATAPDGSVWWVCETQPREYTDAAGRVAMVRDHYLQREQCPEIPIK